MKVQGGLGGSLVLLVLLCGCVSAEDGTDKCKLMPESASERKVLNRLTPLLHRNFTVSKKDDKESDTYVFQLCGDADGVAGAGLVQNDGMKKTIVGRYNSTMAIEGSDWVMLVYENGEKYNTHCGGGSRKAMIMISCNRTKDVGLLEVVVDDRAREDCFYLFEMDSSAVCPAIESKLSAGSIILIIGTEMGAAWRLCWSCVWALTAFIHEWLA